MATVKDLSIEEFQELVAETVRRALDDYFEDRETMRSQPYLESIEEARGEYRRGETIAASVLDAPVARPGVDLDDTSRIWEAE